MQFGEISVSHAFGAVLAHSLESGGHKFRKGHRLDQNDITVLQGAGIETVTAAVLSDADVDEDRAADRIAGLIAGQNIKLSKASTGRVNLYAARRGVFLYDRYQLDALNLIDEAVTCAALHPHDVVEDGQMIATVKIIPYAIHTDILSACEKTMSQSSALFQVPKLRPKRVAILQTRLAKTRDKVLQKTSKVTSARVEGLGGSVVAEQTCAHATSDIAAALDEIQGHAPDIIIISGATAISDRRDVIPLGIERSGGTTEHFGMPMDPGNLLLLAYLQNGTPVVGLPGCAKSPKFNGFDIVLANLIADQKLTSPDIMKLGAGGLLQEIRSRPMPREKAERS